MKQLLAAIVSMTLALNAAPNSPTFQLECATTVNGCAASQMFTFKGANYNPHKTYLIEGSSPHNPTESFMHDVTPDSNGNISDQDFLPAGDWTFTVYVADHKLAPQKLIKCIDVVFE